MAVSFDLFGTLLAVDRPADPAGAIGTELATRGVHVPEDWTDAYQEHHISTANGREVALSTHVQAALASRRITPSSDVIHDALDAVFDPRPRTRVGAETAVEGARIGSTPRQFPTQRMESSLPGGQRYGIRDRLYHLP